MKDEPTASTMAAGLAKLIREVRQLQTEVTKLRADLRGFTGGRKQFPHWRSTPVLPPETGGAYEAKAEKDEPQSAIMLARYEYGENPNLEIPTRTLLAIAKELDGTLRDVRAARLDIKAIADDSDLRNDFKEWQRNQR
ncbi:hypothetical protein [Aurantimonas endophytica]|uniref:Uncharacterized protein n=1 Tax=Aurantimonas endophytica TaxID=1522175 RepID=A0A7W6HAL6_9HYPH|nr:hypothetical protein [Aurantimonas endophytica]MBB4001576.1 hypothetical protein [Aurantimonas endophytica]MCO6402783.1 hypothetical protein [Aurantimonas endophytica]